MHDRLYRFPCRPGGAVHCGDPDVRIQNDLSMHERTELGKQGRVKWTPLPHTSKGIPFLKKNWREKGRPIHVVASGDPERGVTWILTIYEPDPGRRSNCSCSEEGAGPRMRQVQRSGLLRGGIRTAERTRDRSSGRWRPV